MSDPETFVARWSRLKRQSEKEAAEQDATAAGQPKAASAPAAPKAAGEAAGAEPTGSPAPGFDPESLPSIESIAADTDIRAFMQSGVPGALTKAALRRAWSADPAVRDFIGLAENQWDFTDPTAIGGFGTLEATGDVRKLVAQAMAKTGEPGEQLPEATGRNAPASVRRNTAPSDRAPSVSGMQEPGVPHESPRDPPATTGAPDQQGPVDVAMRDDEQPAKQPRQANRRGHGSALPQ